MSPGARDTPTAGGGADPYSLALGPAAAGAGPGSPTPTPGVITGVDHVAIAVSDLGAAVAWYRTMFGAEVAHREKIESDGVEEALLRVGTSYIQLLTPTRPDSPVATFLDRRGEGVHHVGYRVDDCALALQAAKRAGAQVVDSRPRPGSRGTMVAFLHPKAALGTLIELVQE
ncbi:MAG: methylmalonyl-CoA epimerase [Acidimicrobiales bacterium]